MLHIIMYSYNVINRTHLLLQFSPSLCFFSISFITWFITVTICDWSISQPLASFVLSWSPPTAALHEISGMATRTSGFFPNFGNTNVFVSWFTKFPFNSWRKQEKKNSVTQVTLKIKNIYNDKASEEHFSSKWQCHACMFRNGSVFPCRNFPSYLSMEYSFKLVWIFCKLWIFIILLDEMHTSQIISNPIFLTFTFWSIITVDVV